MGQSAQHKPIHNARCSRRRQTSPQCRHPSELVVSALLCEKMTSTTKPETQRIAYKQTDRHANRNTSNPYQHAVGQCRHLAVLDETYASSSIWAYSLYYTETLSHPQNRKYLTVQKRERLGLPPPVQHPSWWTSSFPYYYAGRVYWKT